MIGPDETGTMTMTARTLLHQDQLRADQEQKLGAAACRKASSESLTQKPTSLSSSPTKGRFRKPKTAA